MIEERDDERERRDEALDEAEQETGSAAPARRIGRLFAAKSAIHSS
jgi:hypothetical protein